MGEQVDAEIEGDRRGPYACVRNPMQTGMTVTYLLLGLLDPHFLIGAVVSVAYGAGLAAWH